MSGPLDLRLEILPGRLRAEGIQGVRRATGMQGKQTAGAAAQERGVAYVLTLEVPLWTAERKNKVLRELAAHPGELYELLQGALTDRLAGLGLLPADSELEAAAYEQGEGTATRAELQELITKQLSAEPLLALSLRGLGKEELLTGVFGLWAEEISEVEEGLRASGALAAELARLERKGPAVPSGEWLAEAAAEGSLHQPGPLFHEIAARPFPVSPVVAEPTENWPALLPKTPGATEGLKLIMQRVAEAAARRAAGLSKL